jgi:integral membrane sensor domain MASE1
MATKMLKLLVSPLLIPFVFASGLEAVLAIGESVTLDQFKWILAGSVGFLLLTPVLLSQNLNFLRVFEHESGHMLTHLVFFRTIYE